MWRLWNHTYWISATPTHTLLDKTQHRSGRLCVSVILDVRVCVCVALTSGNAWRSEIEEVETSSISMGSLIYLPSLPPCFYSETHTDRLCLTGTESHTNTHTICVCVPWIDGSSCWGQWGWIPPLKQGHQDSSLKLHWEQGGRSGYFLLLDSWKS